MTVLSTARLRLEPMASAHYAGLRALNSDPEVMRYITGAAETPEETRAVIERVQGRWRTVGYSWWSFLDRETGELVGAGCIQHLGHDPANPHEIGWRLRREHWGKGYAIEAARRMARFAFEELDAPLLCAICDPDNAASARVMQKLGMRYQGEETWHGCPVSVYQLERAAWLAGEAA
ncbi:GNAT family N-acetyltransferase [Massilia sp. ST3]|uniref:GNAT family N-acetyltransferase n=1 Tax=Massilia sp. ST3 TaxID=2824903 RepID=UPI001B83A554|nr:GNAT family N-acetyltransferase [Massilia sp. ST3]MBQ5948116.1 GNAT family N-acetyltransferase [Massilia sp. ST3]